MTALEVSPVVTIGVATTRGESSRLANALPDFLDAQLALWSDTLDGIEDLRNATGNRLYQINERGGLGSKEAAALEGLMDGLKQIEHDAVLQLQRTLRKHPLGSWVKATVGIGEKQGARLIAAIGDPYWMTTFNMDGSIKEDRPRRGPAELWAYCGYHLLHPGQGRAASQDGSAGVDPLGPDHRTHDSKTGTVGANSSDTSDQNCPAALSLCVAGVAPRRARGQRANWNATAKMRAHLCAEAAIKAGVRRLDAADDRDGYDLVNRKATTPLGQTYLDGRAKYLERLHAHPCVRCGPSGKPAQPGTPWSAAHQHAAALRLVAKEILKDLWREAKRLHEAGEWS